MCFYTAYVLRRNDFDVVVVVGLLAGLVGFVFPFCPTPPRTGYRMTASGQAGSGNNVLAWILLGCDMGPFWPLPDFLSCIFF